MAPYRRIRMPSGWVSSTTRNLGTPRLRSLRVPVAELRSLRGTTRPRAAGRVIDRGLRGRDARNLASMRSDCGLTPPGHSASCGDGPGNPHSLRLGFVLTPIASALVGRDRQPTRRRDVSMSSISSRVSLIDADYPVGAGRLFAFWPFRLSAWVSLSFLSGTGTHSGVSPLR